MQQDKAPACPKCGNLQLQKEVSRFAMLKGVPEPAAPTQAPQGDTTALPDVDESRMERAMNEMEQAMNYLDENNPKHMAIMMKKMKEMMPEGTIPKEMDVAIRRLEQGEDPEKIEADMGDLFGQLMGDESGGTSGGGGGGGYSRDPELYDY
jgi:hypothetical protein